MSVWKRNLPRRAFLVFLAPLVSLLPARAFAAVEIGLNFTGSTLGIESGYVPPDCNGAAGPNHYVEFINGRFSVYAKPGAARVLTLTDKGFWTRAGLTFGSGISVTDPRILYDPSAQRWFASAIDFNSSAQSSNRFLLAVSTGADPTASWRAVAFPVDPAQGNFGDFPTLGLDANGVYLGAYVFSRMTGNGLGVTLVSIPKARLLANPPVATNRTWFGILSTSSRGFILQPAVNFDGSAGDARILAVGSLGLDFNAHSTLVSSSLQDAAGPASATLTAATTISVSPYTVPINPAQPDGSTSLDDGDARISATVYQVGGILYAVHGVEISSRAAIRWYKINAANNAVLQSGTIADSNLNLFYPSIAANPSGTVVIAFNGCSMTTFISSYAVVGETQNGLTTFGNLLLLRAGEFSYKNLDRDGVSRWGDYSSTCVDPADPHRFWTIQMYPSGTRAWSTQITELLTSMPQLSIARAGDKLIVSWPGTVTEFNLESSPNLRSTSNWTRVLQSLSTNNGRTEIQLPLPAGANFFRLHKP